MPSLLDVIAYQSLEPADVALLQASPTAAFAFIGEISGARRKTTRATLKI